MLGLHATRLAFALLGSMDASYALIGFRQASATKAFKDKSTSQYRAYKPRLHKLANGDTRTSLHDFNDNIIEVTSAKRPLNPFKRLLKTDDNKVSD